MTLRGLILSIGTLFIFLLIFVPLARRILGGTDRQIDAERMRRVYVALSLYEMGHDGLPAPNLGLVREDLDPSDLQSVSDPLVKEEPSNTARNMGHSYDAALPNLPYRSPTRVSWSYRWHWPNSGNPVAVRMDPRKGVLASWWEGPIMRVNTDGSLREVPRTNTERFDFADLFGK